MRYRGIGSSCLIGTIFVLSFNHSVLTPVLTRTGLLACSQ